MISDNYIENKAILERLTAQALMRKYGENIDEKVRSRLENDAQYISADHLRLFLIAHEIAEVAKEKGGVVQARRRTGSAFVSYLLGLTEINPLPPHYRCEKCKKLSWLNAWSGFDVQNATCPDCGGAFIGDGHNIPYIAFDVVRGQYSVCLSVSGNAISAVEEYIKKAYSDAVIDEEPDDINGAYEYIVNFDFGVITISTYLELDEYERLHTYYPMNEKTLRGEEISEVIKVLMLIIDYSHANSRCLKAMENEPMMFSDLICALAFSSAVAKKESSESLPPKAEVTELALLYLRLAWYRKIYPDAVEFTKIVI